MLGSAGSAWLPAFEGQWIVWAQPPAGIAIKFPHDAVHPNYGGPLALRHLPFVITQVSFLSSFRRSRCRVPFVREDNPAPGWHPLRGPHPPEASDPESGRMKAGDGNRGGGMKTAGNVIAALLILVGIVWFLQGINVLPGSFMTGQIQWAIAGVISFLIGAGLLFAIRRGGSRSQ